MKPLLLQWWTYSQSDGFERKALRRIDGPLQKKSIWRNRYNGELYVLLKESKLTTVIRLTRLHWAGHVERMGVNQTSKRLVHTYKARRTKGHTGRQKARWLDEANSEHRKICIRRRWAGELDKEYNDDTSTFIFNTYFNTYHHKQSGLYNRSWPLEWNADNLALK